MLIIEVMTTLHKIGRGQNKNEGTYSTYVLAVDEVKQPFPVHALG